MAKGEASYSSAGKTVQRFENKPIPKGDYNLTLLEKGLEIRRSKEKGPDAIPYIGCRYAAEGTEGKEGGKPRLVFVNYFLSMKPGADGVIMPERQGGIVEFMRANGKELDVGVKTLTKEDGSTEQYLDAEAILEMLQEMTDTTTPAYVTIEAGRDPKGADDRNKVSYWGAKEEAEEEEEEKEPAKPASKGKLPAKKK